MVPELYPFGKSSQPDARSFSVKTPARQHVAEIPTFLSNKMGFGDLKSRAGQEALNNFLADKSYMEG